MSKYKILKEFVMNGVLQKLDSIVELDYVKAHLKSIQANIEKVPDNVASSTGSVSVLDSLKPGELLTPEQKEKLAKENLTESVEAQRLAAEHRMRDQQEGKGEPVVKTIADALRDKLVNKEFESKGAPAPTPTE